MARNGPRTTPIRYGWVDLLESWRTPSSARGEEGLDYLRDLADNAGDRREGALGGTAPERLTIAALAREHGVSPQRVRWRIRQAIVELLGTREPLSDSAIYYRLRRDRKYPPNRPCDHGRCTRTLPDGAAAHRRYCTKHSRGNWRAARYRQRHGGQPKAPK
jgi:hypothetical protein